MRYKMYILRNKEIELKTYNTYIITNFVGLKKKLNFLKKLLFY